MVFGSKMVKMDNSWRHYDVTRQNNVDLELENDSICVSGLSFLGIEGEITTKSVIKGVKVAHMLAYD